MIGLRRASSSAYDITGISHVAKKGTLRTCRRRRVSTNPSSNLGSLNFGWEQDLKIFPAPTAKTFLVVLYFPLPLNSSILSVGRIVNRSIGKIRFPESRTFRLPRQGVGDISTGYATGHFGRNRAGASVSIFS